MNLVCQRRDESSDHSDATAPHGPHHGLLAAVRASRDLLAAAAHKVGIHRPYGGWPVLDRAVAGDLTCAESQQKQLITY
jgi:hypothetical protein